LFVSSQTLQLLGELRFSLFSGEKVLLKSWLNFGVTLRVDVLKNDWVAEAPGCSLVSSIFSCSRSRGAARAVFVAAVELVIILLFSLLWDLILVSIYFGYYQEVKATDCEQIDPCFWYFPAIELFIPAEFLIELFVLFLAGSRRLPAGIAVGVMLWFRPIAIYWGVLPFYKDEKEALLRVWEVEGLFVVGYTVLFATQPAGICRGMLYELLLLLGLFLALGWELLLFEALGYLRC
jgi:hypothetical protein